MGRRKRLSIYYFLAKCVVNPYGCWGWTGKFNKQSKYAECSYQRKKIPAHRISYEFFIGKIPAGYHLHHKCENPSCSNPEHLKIVSPKEHIRLHDGPPGINARKEFCHNGHKFTEINTYITPDGRRQCRECRIIISRKHYSIKKSHLYSPCSQGTI